MNQILPATYYLLHAFSAYCTRITPYYMLHTTDFILDDKVYMLLAHDMLHMLRFMSSTIDRHPSTMHCNVSELCY